MPCLTVLVPCALFDLAGVGHLIQTCLFRLRQIFSLEFNFLIFIPMQGAAFFNQKPLAKLLQIFPSVSQDFAGPNRFSRNIFKHTLVEFSIGIVCSSQGAAFLQSNITNRSLADVFVKDRFFGLSLVARAQLFPQLCG